MSVLRDNFYNLGLVGMFYTLQMSLASITFLMNLTVSLILFEDNVSFFHFIILYFSLVLQFYYALPDHNLLVFVHHRIHRVSCACGLKLFHQFWENLFKYCFCPFCFSSFWHYSYIFIYNIFQCPIYLYLFFSLFCILFSFVVQSRYFLLTYILVHYFSLQQCSKLNFLLYFSVIEFLLLSFRDSSFLLKFCILLSISFTMFNTVFEMCVS